MNLKKGTEFHHSKWLEANNKDPLHAVVTRVAHGVVYWKPKSGGKSMYFPQEDAHKYVKQIIKEDGAVMSAGNGGFSSSASASGPVAGYDPMMKLKKNMKNRIKKNAARPPSDSVPIGDSV